MFLEQQVAERQHGASCYTSWKEGEGELVSSGISIRCGVNILPICAHMIPLSIAAAESNQTSVAGIRERGNGDVGVD